MAEDEGTGTTGTESTDPPEGTGSGVDRSNDGKTDAQRIKDMETALRKANKEAADNRLKATKLEEQYATDAEKKVKEEIETAKKAEIEKWQPRVVKSEARNLLREAGAGTAAVSRLLNLIDVKVAEVDDEGNVSGLDTQITTIKKEWPELFVEKKTGQNGGPSGRAVGAGDKGAGGGDQTKRSAAAIAKALGAAVE